MEYITAPLTEAQTGRCHACPLESATLTAVVVTIDRDHTNRGTSKHPEIVGTQAHLICSDCAAGHPLWRLPEESRR